MEQRETTEYTGCLLPCQYKEFSLVGSPVRGFGSKLDLSFGIMFGSGTIEVAREEKIYPLSSFIAEFGGCLGMFLGFSFLMVVNFLQENLLNIKQKLVKTATI